MIAIEAMPIPIRSLVSTEAESCLNCGALIPARPKVCAICLVSVSVNLLRTAGGDATTLSGFVTADDAFTVYVSQPPVVSFRDQYRRDNQSPIFSF